MALQVNENLMNKINDYLSNLEFDSNEIFSIERCDYIEDIILFIKFNLIDDNLNYFYSCVIYDFETLTKMNFEQNILPDIINFLEKVRDNLGEQLCIHAGSLPLLRIRDETVVLIFLLDNFCNYYDEGHVTWSFE